jgi:MarR family 2-MHQ and catechol resistance regulon transcriptional repressor
LLIGEIGEKVLLTSGSMTAAVNRLERIGHVKRTRTTEDARCFSVALTPAGQNTIEAAWSKHEKNLEMVAEELSPEERSELVRLLKKIGYRAALVESRMQGISDREV